MNSPFLYSKNRLSIGPKSKIYYMSMTNMQVIYKCHVIDIRYNCYYNDGIYLSILDCDNCSIW